MAKMESRQTEIWTVLFVTFTAATIITILRLVSRRLKRNSLSWDDYFALCGFVSYCSSKTSNLQPLIVPGHLGWLDHHCSLL